jgi:hypothetical protein
MAILLIVEKMVTMAATPVPMEVSRLFALISHPKCFVLALVGVL